MSALATDTASPYGVPVDVVFADTLPEAVKQAMLKDARRAGTRKPRKRSSERS